MICEQQRTIIELFENLRAAIVINVMCADLTFSAIAYKTKADEKSIKAFVRRCGVAKTQDIKKLILHFVQGLSKHEEHVLQGLCEHEKVYISKDVVCRYENE